MPKSPIFFMDCFEPKPKSDTLEGHLVEVAKRWINGESALKIVTLEAFFLLMKTERAWYLRDHNNQKKDVVDIAIDYDEHGRKMLVIKGITRMVASAQIKAIIKL